MKHIVCLFFILLFTSIAMGEEPLKLSMEYIQPYPAPKITAEEWNAFHEKVAKDMKAEMQTLDGQQMEVFIDDEKGLQIAFTTEGHPAHPAWVTRYTYMIDESYNFGEIGFFGGKEEPFAKLFKFQKAVTAKMRQSLIEQHAKKSKQ